MKTVPNDAEGKTLNRGAYCLVISLARDTIMAVGARPPHKFPAGYYCYVGSAMNNLDKRIARHFSPEKRRRWHIDYFLDQAAITAVLTFESTRRRECALSQAVAGPADGLVMKGFGSSDCRCRTHLHYFREDPLPLLEKILQKFTPVRKKPKMKGLG